MSEFLKLTAGAFFGVIVGLLVQWWKSHREELRILCDESCRTVTEAADIASKYWLSDGAADDSKPNEARLLALQTRLDGYRVLLNQLFGGGKAIDSALVEFYDVLTGGLFKSAKRAIDSDRAQAAHAKASIVILSIRNTFYDRVSFSRSFLRLLEWALPYRRPDTQAGKAEEAIYLCAFFRSLSLGACYTLPQYGTDHLSNLGR
jgi:hypothetical protein